MWANEVRRGGCRLLGNLYLATIMRVFGGLAAVVLSASLSAAALARDVKIGDATFSVAPPPGYCEVDEAQEGDKGWLTSIHNLLMASDATLIAAFPDCKELGKMRATNEFIVAKVFVTANNASIGKASSQSVVDTCNDLKQSGEKYTSEGKEKVAENVKKYSPNSLDDNKFLGVLEDVDGEVCYSAQFLKVTTYKGQAVRILDIIAAATARGNLIFLYSFTPYIDANSLQTGLAKIKAIYADFVAANPK